MKLFITFTHPQTHSHELSEEIKNFRRLIHSILSSSSKMVYNAITILSSSSKRVIERSVFNDGNEARPLKLSVRGSKLRGVDEASPKAKPK